MNFISRLHRNRLDIVPWPVIESKQFYTLFKAIKKRLDQQPVTHTGGAIFLQTMKTLMAKLKVSRFKWLVSITFDVYLVFRPTTGDLCLVRVSGVFDHPRTHAPQI